MSLWTLAEAQAIVTALKLEILNNPTGIGSVSIAGRSISYNSFDDLQKRIIFWSRELATLQRLSAGGRRTAYSVAKFN